MSEWKAWNGGECPVKPDDYVNIQTRTGNKQEKVLASSLVWDKTGSSYDIVYYTMWGNPKEIEQEDMHARLEGLLNGQLALCSALENMSMQNSALLELMADLEARVSYLEGFAPKRKDNHG